MQSKAWDWKQVSEPDWLEPSEESYYLAHRWKTLGFRQVLDFGCGLGRHAIFFARQGFRVSAFDLSADGAEHLRQWSIRERLPVDVEVADMLSLPYENREFDAIFAYNVISHTDSVGIRQILREIARVLKPGGEVFLTLCSKETWSFREGGYPKVDENTVIRTDEGPEQGIPHFYVDLEDIFSLMKAFELLKIRHIEDCQTTGHLCKSKHYFITARLPREDGDHDCK